jgi:hypothetical protein
LNLFFLWSPAYLASWLLIHGHPYTDEDVKASIVDTYESSAWGVMYVGTRAAVGAALAIVLGLAARYKPQKAFAAVQLVALVGSTAVVAVDHYMLMQRATRVTGQTFGGFP